MHDWVDLACFWKINLVSNVAHALQYLEGAKVPKRELLMRTASN
jgi:hypothetical protein